MFASRSGAWIPLLHMYPDADVPVIPVSIQSHLGPEGALRLGRALAPLARQGFLVIASGNITHNLRDWQMCSMLGQSTPDYVHQFADWVHTQMLAGDAEYNRGHGGEDESGKQV